MLRRIEGCLFPLRSCWIDAFFFFFKKAEQLHFSSVDLNRCLFEMSLNVWGIL